MPTASSPGIDLHYETFGEGPPLLLIHGLAAQMILWPDDFCRMLADRGFQVIRFDNRDIGLSTKTDGPPPTARSVLRAMITRSTSKHRYTLADMAGDAVRLLDHLGIERAHVVGASMGGMIAQQLTIDHPQRVASLCSIMSNTGDRTHGLAKVTTMVKGRKLLFGKPPTERQALLERDVRMSRLISGPHFDEPTIRQIMSAQLDRCDDQVGAAWQMLAIAASPARNAALATVTAPTLVIHGMLDPLVLPSGGRTTAACIPNATLLMFNDMAHDLPRVRWPEIVEAIADNTARVAAAQHA